MVERILGSRILDAFLSDLESGIYVGHWDGGELRRIRVLMTRYSDLPLGFADASVIVCAERNGGQVLTLDYRRFGVVAREGTIVVVPEPA